MYQINNRFWIGVGIIEAGSIAIFSLCTIGLHIAVAMIFFIILNAIYFSVFFISLHNLNEHEKLNQKEEEKVGQENVFHISKQEAKQFLKEGALQINGKTYINKDFKLWKEMQKTVSEQ